MTGKTFRHRAQKKKRRRLFWCSCAVLAMCAVLLTLVDRAYGPVVREFAKVQAKYLAVTAINQACNAELAAYPVSWQELVQVTRDARLPLPLHALALERSLSL